MRRSQGVAWPVFLPTLFLDVLLSIRLQFYKEHGQHGKIGNQSYQHCESGKNPKIDGRDKIGED
jgi:hypothetical protein